MELIFVNTALFMIQGNVGLIFTKGDLKEVSDEIAKYKVCTLML